MALTPKEVMNLINDEASKILREHPIANQFMIRLGNNGIEVGSLTKFIGSQNGCPERWLETMKTKS